MKTIYAVYNGLPCKINQMFDKVPSVIADRTQDFVPEYDSIAKTSTIHINLRTDAPDAMLTNKEAYNNFLTYLTEQKATKINNLYAPCKLLLEYELRDCTSNKPIDQGILIEEVLITNALVPLGCDSSSELVYRQVQQLKATADLSYRTSKAMGILRETTGRAALVIRNIMVLMANTPLEAIEGYNTYSHPVHENVCLNRNFNRYGQSIRSVLDSMTVIYDSAAKGLTFKDIMFPERPRRITIPIELLVEDYIVAYATGEVDRIIAANVAESTDPDQPGCGCGCEEEIDKLEEAVGTLENNFNQYVTSDVTDRIDEDSIDQLFE